MLLDDVATILTGIVTPGTDLFFGGLPEQPVNCVSLLQYMGHPPLYTMGSGSSPSLDRPRVQVFVRNTDQKAAWQKMEAVNAALRWYSGTVGGTKFHNIVPVSSAFEDLDEMSREGRRGITYRVSQDYELWISPAS